MAGWRQLNQSPAKAGSLPTRQTLNMLVRAARSTISDDERDAGLSRTAERLTTTGPFEKIMFVRAGPARGPREVLEIAGIDDARATRLVILDPRQFSLLTGWTKTREPPCGQRWALVRTRCRCNGCLPQYSLWPTPCGFGNTISAVTSVSRCTAGW